MNNKDGFIIYKSFYAPIQNLSDELLGKLFRAIFEYQINGTYKELPPDIMMAFNFFKSRFDIDTNKYEEIINRNKENGKKGGRPNKKDKENIDEFLENENPNNPVGYEEPKKADKDRIGLDMFSLIKKEDTTVSKKAIDYDLILTKWKETCSMLTTPRSIDEKRKAKIRTLLKNHNADIEELFKCFEIISKSVFLTNADGDNKNNWKATFDWLINDTNSCYNGIFEGKYNFKNKPNAENLGENKTDEIIINGIKYQS